MDERQAITVIRRELGIAGEDWVDAESLKFKGTNLVVTTDMLTKPDDFPPGMAPFDIGWTSVAANLSDLAAAGAKPLGILVAWGLPGGTDEKTIIEITRGMNACANSFNTRVLGGDVNRHSTLTLSGVAFGCADKPVTRSGAHPGDVLAVTGTLGVSAAGYLALTKNLKGHSKAIRGFSRPVPRIREMLSLSKYVSAATDLSDGFEIGVQNICEMSGVGAIIDDVPIAPGVKEVAKEVSREISELLNMGSDYEILLTVPERNWGKVKSKLYRVGTIVGGKYRASSGWQHSF
jgi:thiamine-monophosphate kinase